MLVQSHHALNKVIAKDLKLHHHHKDVYFHVLGQIRHRSEKFKDTSTVERVFMMITLVLKILMPSFWLRHFCKGKKNTREFFELYVLLKPIFFGIILALGRYTYTIVAWIVIYFLLDFLLYTIGILVLSDIFSKPVNIRKGLILLGINYREIILGFAILYLHFDAISLSHPYRTSQAIEAVYYSISAFSTVGFGDVIVTNDIGIVISIIQLIVSIVFVGIILGSYVGRLQLKDE